MKLLLAIILTIGTNLVAQEQQLITRYESSDKLISFAMPRDLKVYEDKPEDPICLLRVRLQKDGDENPAVTITVTSLEQSELDSLKAKYGEDYFKKGITEPALEDIYTMLKSSDIDFEPVAQKAFDTGQVSGMAYVAIYTYKSGNKASDVLYFFKKGKLLFLVQYYITDKRSVEVSMDFLSTLRVNKLIVNKYDGQPEVTSEKLKLPEEGPAPTNK